MSKTSPLSTTHEAMKRRAKIPDSWIKAAGILRGTKPDPIKELKKMRKHDEASSRKLQKEARHDAR